MNCRFNITGSEMGKQENERGLVGCATMTRELLDAPDMRTEGDQC